jgi:predicted  nucleic acid-binding Zn-ribbon protein
MKFEGFRKVVNAVINFVIGYFEYMVNMWIRAINIVISGINLFGGILRAVGIEMPKIGKIGEVSFGRIKNSADKATGSTTRLLGQIQAIKNEERQMESAKGFDITQGMGDGGGPVETAKQKLEKYMQALKQVKDQTKGVTEATKSLTDAQKNITKATQAVTEAQENLSKATKAVEEAELHLEKVRKGLGSGSKESMSAADKVAEAQRELEDAGYTLEERTYAVKDAEEELAKLRADSTTPLRSLREAEINLARAKIALTEAGISQRDTTRQLSSAQAEYEEITNGAKEGSDRLKEALDAVDEAKKKQIEASDKLVEAQEKVVEAIDKEKDATEKLRDAKWELFDAEKALQDLRKEVGNEIADRATRQFNTRQIIEEVIQPIVDSTVTIGLPPAEQGAVDRGLLTPGQGEELARRRGLVPFAQGGIVTQATMGLVGEAGAEAIIPLDRLQGLGNTYNIQVTAGMGADGKDIGTQIVNALKRYERTNGALPLTVA